MSRIINYVVLYIYLLVYIYSIVFDFFPISTKIILELIGLLYCTKKILSSHYIFKYEFKIIVLLLSILVIWDIIISIAFGQSEYMITSYSVALLASFFGSELIYRQFVKLRSEPDYFFYNIIISVVFVSILAILMKVFPAFYEFLESFLVFEFGDLKLEHLARLHGIGNAIYFGVLPSCAIGVMCSVYCISKETETRKLTLLYAFWFIISIVSFLIARWSLLVFAISFLYYLYGCKKQKMGKVLFQLLILGFIGVAAFFIVMNNIDDKLYSWAFSFMVDKKNDDGTLQTVINWWLNTDLSLQTFLFGDARYSNPDGSYYNRIDIGIFRQIFYGGVVYLLLNLYLHFKILLMTYKYKKTVLMKGFIYFSIFAYIGILGKGNANMASFYILFLVIFSGGLFKSKKSSLYF